MTEEATNQAEQAGLSLQDIATSVQIIDICSKRGGFEGSELEAVGGLRSRLMAFLEANRPKDEEAPAGEVPVEEDSAEESAES